MKTLIATLFAVSVLAASTAWADHEKSKEMSESETGVESIAEEAEDAPAEIPNALKGDQMGTESADGGD